MFAGYMQPGKSKSSCLSRYCVLWWVECGCCCCPPIHPQQSSQSSVSVCCDSHLTTSPPALTPTPLEAQPLDTRYCDKDYGKQRFENPKTSQQDITSRESRELPTLVPLRSAQLHLFCSTIPQCNAVGNESPGFAVYGLSL